MFTVYIEENNHLFESIWRCYTEETVIFYIVQNDIFEITGPYHMFGPNYFRQNNTSFIDRCLVSRNMIFFIKVCFWEGSFHVWKYFSWCFWHLAMLILMRCEWYFSIVSVPKWICWNSFRNYSAGSMRWNRRCSDVLLTSKRPSGALPLFNFTSRFVCTSSESYCNYYGLKGRHMSCWPYWGGGPET